jgi:hypothetical protein
MALNIGWLCCRNLPESEVDRTRRAPEQNDANDPERSGSQKNDATQQRVVCLSARGTGNPGMVSPQEISTKGKGQHLLDSVPIPDIPHRCLGAKWSLPEAENLKSKRRIN